MRGLMGALAAPGRKDAQTLDFLPSFLMNTESRTGISVNWATALQVTTMFACARVIGEDIAASRCYLQTPRNGRPGWDDAVKHPLYRLLYVEPMKGITAFTFWETIVFHVMFVGNAFVFINRTGGGIFELILLDPGKVQVARQQDYSFRYTVTGDDGLARAVPSDTIWHIRGPSWNGWMGMETVKVAREALGLSLALEASHARMHRDGVKPSGVYSIEGQLDDKKYAQLANWLKKFSAANTGDPLILDNGAKWLNQAMSGVDQQHLETRRFQIEEVCRSVRVLPIMVMSSDKAATYASSEQMFLAHRMHGLMPWSGRLEQAGEVALLTDSEKRAGMRLRFNLDEAMRADFKSRQEGRQIQRRNGVINADEWREGEDMNPRTDPGGGQYLVEANMAIQDGRDLPPPTGKLTGKE